MVCFQGVCDDELEKITLWVCLFKQPKPSGQKCMKVFGRHNNDVIVIYDFFIFDFSIDFLTKETQVGDLLGLVTRKGEDVAVGNRVAQSLNNLSSFLGR